MSTIKSTDFTQWSKLVTYTFTGTNTGTVTLNNVKISETSFNGSGKLSPLSCDPVTTLAPGGTIKCTTTYMMTDTDVRKGRTITNTANIVGATITGKSVTATDDATTAPRPNSGITYRVCYGSSDCDSPVIGLTSTLNSTGGSTGTVTSNVPNTWDILTPGGTNTLTTTIPAWATITDVLIDGVSVGTTIPTTVTAPNTGFKNIVVVVNTTPKGSSTKPTPPIFESGL